MTFRGREMKHSNHQHFRFYRATLLFRIVMATLSHAGLHTFSPRLLLFEVFLSVAQFKFVVLQWHKKK